MSKETARMWQIAGRYSALGIEMAVAVAMGTFGGNWLDTRWGSSPVCMLLGFVAGVGAAIVGVRRALSLSRRNEQGPPPDQT